MSLVVGGRHPYATGHHYTEVVTDDRVCVLGGGGVENDGGSAGYVDGYVIMCGGRTMSGPVSSCMKYNLERETWSQHSSLTMPRERAAMAVLGSQVFIMGGEGLTSVEVLGSVLETVWLPGPELPFILSRSCAVSTGSAIILAGGYTNMSSTSMVMSLTREQGWTMLESMKEARREHACLYVEMEGRKGMLVTGGVGQDEDVLSSGEFYDVSSGEWSMVSSLVVPRKEHVMSLVHDVPTAIGKNCNYYDAGSSLCTGGVSDDQFLSSMEVFTMIEKSAGRVLDREWRLSNKVLAVQRFQHAVAGVPSSKVRMINLFDKFCQAQPKPQVPAQASQSWL